jgi:glycine betaine/choline ABC-type transport system substrate-binding protein
MVRPIGFNNAYALMMREKQAKELNIKTISTLNDIWIASNTNGFSRLL